MEELINSNLQSYPTMGEVQLVQTTVEGTEADLGTKQKWVCLNRAK